jgi:hypothetical protein
VTCHRSVVSSIYKTDCHDITEILMKVYIVAVSFIGGGNTEYPEKTTDLLYGTRMD